MGAMKASTTDFVIEQREIPEGLRLTIKGNIGDTAVFPPTPSSATKRIVVDLGGVKIVNSFGVRLWMRWVWALEKDLPKVKIELENCPPMFVKQMLIVKNFSPQCVSVKSVLIPYYCESCSDTKYELLTQTDPRLSMEQGEAVEAIFNSTCTKCKSEMEIDMDPEMALQSFKL